MHQVKVANFPKQVALGFSHSLSNWRVNYVVNKLCTYPGVGNLSRGTC